jgi:hypothetical protein
VDIFPRLQKLIVDDQAKDSATFYSLLGMIRPQITEIDVFFDHHYTELSFASLTAMDRAEMLSHAEACTHLERLSWNLFFKIQTRIDVQFFQRLQSCLTQASFKLVSVELLCIDWPDFWHLARCPRLRLLALTLPNAPYNLVNHPEPIKGVSFADLRDLRITDDTSAANVTHAILRTKPSQLEIIVVRINTECAWDFDAMCSLFTALSDTGENLKEVMFTNLCAAWDETLTHKEVWSLLEPLCKLSSLTALIFNTTTALSLSGSRTVQLLTFWPNMRYLEMKSQHSGKTIISLVQLRQIFEACPSLEWLHADVNLSSLTHNPAIPTSFPHHPNLKELRLKHIPEDVRSLQTALASALPSLEHIYCDSHDATQRDRHREIERMFGWNHTNSGPGGTNEDQEEEDQEEDQEEDGEDDQE